MHILVMKAAWLLTTACQRWVPQKVAAACAQCQSSVAAAHRPCGSTYHPSPEGACPAAPPRCTLPLHSGHLCARIGMWTP